MKSGIYKLTFKSGMFYIGKSIDIPIRWTQHYDKLRKGTGAARLQAEFNRYHDYNQEVLVHCHADHLDIIETYFINYCDKKLLLNSTFPAPLSRAEYEPILANPQLLQYSTSTHIQVLAEQALTIKELQQALAHERAKPAIIIKEYGNSTGYIEELLLEIDELETENDKLAQTLQKVSQKCSNRSWWSKICG